MNRCPLCLKELKTGAEFLRVCRAHDEPAIGPVLYHPRDRAVFACDAEDCPGDKMDSSLVHGIFLLHVGCECENPFWNAGTNKVDVPSIAQVAWKTGARTFEHWEVDVLRELAKAAPDRKEMWYPIALFEALNGTGHRGRTGCLLLLHGPMSSGKTILATMAMNPESFDRPARELQVAFEVEHFVYVSPSLPGAVVPHAAFLLALYPLSLFRANLVDSTWATATLPVHRYVRATFVRMKREQKEDGEDKAPRGGKGWLGELSEVFGGGRTPWPDTEYLSIVFYDPAGEVSDDPANPQITRLSRAVDAQGVLIDATELARFGSAPRLTAGTLSTIALAEDRLHVLGAHKSRRCVIVTKIDKVVSQLDDQEKVVVRNLLQGRLADHAQLKKLLVAWLFRGGSQEKRLAQALKLDKGCEVLFAWAQDLDDPGRMPRGVGTVDLLSWCLGSDLIAGEPGRR